MNVNEMAALLVYLEFHLMNYTQEVEKHITDEETIGDLYDRTYFILNDLERTMSTQLEIEIANNK